MLTGQIEPVAELSGILSFPAHLKDEGDHIIRSSPWVPIIQHTQSGLSQVMGISKESLTFNGSQYTTIDFVPGRNTRVEIIFHREQSDELRYLFGSGYVTGFTQSNYVFGMKDTGVSAEFGSQRVTQNLLNRTDEEQRIIFDKDKVVLNTTELFRWSEADPFVAANILCIGSVNHHGSPNAMCFKGSIEGVRIYEEDVLVRSYIPAVYCGDEGLYDVLTGSFCIRQNLSGYETVSTGEPPLSFNAQEGNLRDYVIFGNYDGVGDYDAVTGKYNIPVTIRSKNLLEIGCESEVYNGMNITVNADKSITITGTATATSVISLKTSTHQTVGNYQRIDNGVYFISGSPQGSDNNGYILSYRYDSDGDGSTPSVKARVPVEGAVLDNSSGAYQYLSLYIAVQQGTVLDQVTFYPMLRRQGTEEGYEKPFCHRVTLTAEAPLYLGESLSLSQTGTALFAEEGKNYLTVDTHYQPANIYLVYTHQ